MVIVTTPLTDYVRIIGKLQAENRDAAQDRALRANALLCTAIKYTNGDTKMVTTLRRLEKIAIKDYQHAEAIYLSTIHREQAKTKWPDEPEFHLTEALPLKASPVNSVLVVFPLWSDAQHDRPLFSRSGLMAPAVYRHTWR